MRRVTKCLLNAFLIAVLCGGIARAQLPSVADLDSHARASGNRKDIATAIGEQVFSTEWPAQVLQVLANEFDGHLVLGLRVNGVHFHQVLSQSDFEAEIGALVERVFQAAPTAEEVDIWTTVPITVGKGVIVSGDLAKPTTRTVYTISVRRGESMSSVAARLRAGANIYLDEEWARTAFKKTPETNVQKNDASGRP